MQTIEVQCGPQVGLFVSHVVSGHALRDR